MGTACASATWIASADATGTVAATCAACTSISNCASDHLTCSSSSDQTCTKCNSAGYCPATDQHTCERVRPSSSCGKISVYDDYMSRGSYENGEDETCKLGAPAKVRFTKMDTESESYDYVTGFKDGNQVFKKGGSDTSDEYVVDEIRWHTDGSNAKTGWTLYY